MSIGYVGLGVMGSALASRLQLTHQLDVFDLDKQAIERLVQNGSVARKSLKEIAASCDLIFLCLPTSDHVRKAIFGEGGLGPGLRPGTMIIDQTSGDPNATRAMAAELEQRGVDMIDAPVSGGAKGAEAGTISIMLGASTKQFERVQPILRSISPNLFHAGDVGSGHAMKCINNMISGAQRLLTYEGMALAVKFGVDRHKAVEILKAGGARNSFMEKILEPKVVNGDLSLGFTLGLAHKDVRIACQLGSESGVPLLYGNLTQNYYQICINEMGGDSEVETAGLVIDRLTGSEVIPKNYKL